MYPSTRSLLKSVIFGLGILAAGHVFAAEALDSKPMPVKTPPPQYPAEMRREGVSGVVALKVEIDETGAVINCSVAKSSNPAFEASAVDAVKSWKFKPGQKNGAPVKTTITLPIKFTLDE
jgi:protein TonB